MVKRRGLTQEAVVRRAVEMANAARNPDAVTLTGLAASLDIQPPSLYNHIAGMDGLKRGMRLYALTHLSRSLRLAAAGQTGRKALLFLAYAYRQFAHDNPGVYPLILPAVPLDDAAAAEASEEVLTTIVLILGSMGLEGDDAFHAVRGMRSLLHGFVSLEMSGGFAMPLEVDKSFQRAVAAYIDGILG